MEGVALRVACGVASEEAQVAEQARQPAQDFVESQNNIENQNQIFRGQRAPREALAAAVCDRRLDERLELLDDDQREVIKLGLELDIRKSPGPGGIDVGRRGVRNGNRNEALAVLIGRKSSKKIK